MPLSPQASRISLLHSPYPISLRFVSFHPNRLPRPPSTAPAPAFRRARTTSARRARPPPSPSPSPDVSRETLVHGKASLEYPAGARRLAASASCPTSPRPPSAPAASPPRRPRPTPHCLARCLAAPAPAFRRARAHRARASRLPPHPRTLSAAFQRTGLTLD